MQKTKVCWFIPQPELGRMKPLRIKEFTSEVDEEGMVPFSKAREMMSIEVVELIYIENLGYIMVDENGNLLGRKLNLISTLVARMRTGLPYWLVGPAIIVAHEDPPEGSEKTTMRSVVDRAIEWIDMTASAVQTASERIMTGPKGSSR